MKVKTTAADEPLLLWLDQMARFYRRSRSQQILWLLRRLMEIHGQYGSLVDKATIYNGGSLPALKNL